jgi:hypothetical protein
MTVNSKSEITYRKHWQILVERDSLFIVLYQQKLVNPIDNKEVHKSYWVKDRHTT